MRGPPEHTGKMTFVERLRAVPSSELLFLLLSADLLFIVLHLFHTHTPYFSDPGFTIVRERSFSEIYQYLKEYWIALIFVWLGVVLARSYLAWAIVFGYLLLDDAFEVHEDLGLAIATRYDFPDAAMLRPQDFGELAVVAVVGSILLALLAAAYFRGDAQFRRTSENIFLLMLFLVFFGVALDMIHIMVERVALLAAIVAVMEDGGEMVTMSVICWYVLLNLIRTRSPSPGAADSVAVL